jgi:hypothetical protein
MLEKIKFKKGLIDKIKGIFLDNQLLLGDKDDDNLKISIDLIDSGKKDYLDVRELDLQSDDYFIFIPCIQLIKDEENFTDKIVEIERIIETNSNGYRDKKVYFINDSLKNEINFRKKLGNQNSILNKTCNSSTDDRISTEYIIVNNIVSGEYDIKIDSRIRSLEIGLPTEDGLPIKGHVFIANLYDIVKIYSLLGDELFEYNIRVGIKDNLDVNKEIKRTLEDNPEEFWFLNNGITMVVQDSEFSIKKAKLLAIKYGEGKRIGIINGAQTVTAASEFFMENDEVKEAENNAKVMLRIIHLSEADQEDQKLKLREKANKISVSLNRQKPIEPEDLAYTTEFIYNINTVWESYKDDMYTFNIVRRSKTNITGILLDDFARAVHSYLNQKPGQARANSKTKLLKITSDEDTYSFVDKNIFREEFSDKDKATLENLYKFYKPINFAISLANYYQNNANKLKNSIVDEDQSLIVSYSKWFFVAFVIYILNDKKCNDFSTFNGKMSGNEMIDECITMFVDSYKDMFNRDEKKIDSNDFKNEKIYNRFIQSENSSKIEDLKDKIFEIFNYEEYLRRKNNSEAAATSAVE